MRALDLLSGFDRLAILPECFELGLGLSVLSERHDHGSARLLGSLLGEEAAQSVARSGFREQSDCVRPASGVVAELLKPRDRGVCHDPGCL